VFSDALVTPGGDPDRREILVPLDSTGTTSTGNGGFEQCQIRIGHRRIV